jgi:hypothetical protein
MSGHQAVGRARRRLARMLDPGPPPAAAEDAPSGEPAWPQTDALRTLARRIERLEAALEGLQDSIHREAQRRDGEIADLRRQGSPDAIARALSDDARRRGL